MSAGLQAGEIFDKCIGKSNCQMIHQLLMCLWCLFVFVGGLRAKDRCGQAIKGARWMSRRDEATKDVVGCDMPRRAVKRALTLGSPNGETRVRLIPGLTGD